MPQLTPVRPILSPIAVTRLVPVVRDTPALPTQPALRAIAEDVIAEVKYATSVAASHEERGPGVLDGALHDFLTARRPAAQRRARAHAGRLLAAPAEQRSAVFGRYSSIKAADYLGRGQGTPAGLAQMKLNSAQLTTELQAVRLHYLKLPPLGPPPDPDLQAGLAFTKLRFFIRGVRCIEETDEWSESDEINLGAVVADPLGNTWVRKQVEISDDFDAGEKVAYPGIGMHFTGWNIVTSEPWPHVYGLTLAMAEKDDGGFAKFLKELWDYVDDKINALIAAGIGAAIGAEIGGILGAVAGAVLGVLVGWIISLFDNADDIVGAKVLTMTLASAKKSYYDWAKLTSDVGWKSFTNFYGDGGHYRVSYGWKVFTQ
jgi:hypothetical protein